MLLRRTLVCIFILFCIGCGSSDGTDEPVIRILAPQDDTLYQAGDIIEYTLSTQHFDLAPPYNLRTFNIRHGDETDPDHHEGEVEEEHDHVQSDQSTNSAAREGHYHIYLDDTSGSDEHVTAWVYEGEFSLPHDLSVGTHSLRFELRDNEHVPVGTAHSETILFFEIQ